MNSQEAYEVVWNGHRLTGWRAGVVMALCGILPWSVGMFVLILALFGQARITW